MACQFAPSRSERRLRSPTCPVQGRAIDARLTRQAMNRVEQHLHHHRWFYIALVLAGAAWLIADVVAPRTRLFVTIDTFYLSYLLLMGLLVSHATPDELRQRATV